MAKIVMTAEERKYLMECKHIILDNYRDQYRRAVVKLETKPNSKYYTERKELFKKLGVELVATGKEKSLKNLEIFIKHLGMRYRTLEAALPNIKDTGKRNRTQATCNKMRLHTKKLRKIKKQESVGK